MTWSFACRKIFAILVGSLAFSFGLMPSAAADESEHDVENFHYSAWTISYDLSLNAEGRAVAEVTEELQAEFPQYDQNRGIIRSLPLRYHSAPAAPENISVTDESGHVVPFEVEDEDGFRSILVGDDDFVHGSQTYVMSYTVDDVMHATQQADEFYWDLIPVDRRQNIDEVIAEIHLDETLTSALTGSAACYVGTPDDSQACELDQTDGDGAVFRVTESSLQGGHGLTVAIGLEAGTVTQPPERHENFLLDVVPLILVIAATMLAGGGALAVWAMVRRHREDTSQASIQYGIPEHLNPLLAGRLVGKSHDPIVASILDLAVRGVIRIEEMQEATGWRKKTESKPVLRLMDAQQAADPLDRLLLAGMFPGLSTGATFDFPKNSKPFTHATESVIKDSGKAVLERGYQEKKRHRAAALAGWTALGLLLPAVVLLIMGASRDNMPMTAVSIVLGILCLVLIIVCVTKQRVLTPKGAAVRLQLDRMQQLIRAHDADRLQMMQGFTSAPRRHATSDEAQGSFIQLYDRLLPYAVLFGLQKDWTRVMAETYTHYSWPAPIWYPLLFSHHGNAQSALHSMLTSVSSAAATSSPSAGSTGGGAVGGGGGGGAAGGR